MAAGFKTLKLVLCFLANADIFTISNCLGYISVGQQQFMFPYIEKFRIKSCLSPKKTGDILCPHGYCKNSFQAHKTPLSMQCGEDGDFKPSDKFVHLKMPHLSNNEESLKIAKWLKKETQEIACGDTVFVAESEKANVEVDSFTDGYLAKILVNEGSNAKPGESLCVIAKKKSDIYKYNEETSNADNVNTIDIFMPTLSSTMSEGKITSWLKNVGNHIKVGDSILVVESDKADMEVEAFEEGYLAEIIVPAGETVKVGETIAKLVKTKEELTTYKGNKSRIFERTETLIPQEAISSGHTAMKASTENAVAVTAEEQISKTTRIDYIPESLDLFTENQLPANMTSDDLVEEFLRRLRSTTEGRQYIEILQSARNGPNEWNLMLNRVKLRPPTRNILLSDSARGFNNTKRNETRKEILDDISLPTNKVADQVTTSSVLPSAMKLAKKLGVDVHLVRGTGQYGRVTTADVERYETAIRNEASDCKNIHETETIPPKFTSSSFAGNIVPMNPMEKTIARNMEATLNVPVFRVSGSAFTDELDYIYFSVKTHGISMSSLLAKAAAIILQKHQIINSAYDSSNGGSIRIPQDINIAMAVSIDGGLVTPVLKKANIQNIYDLSNTWRDLVEKARSKKLVAADCTGGTFYISNLGMYGVDEFDAILPHGVGAILAIGKASKEVVAINDLPEKDMNSLGIKIRKRIKFTLTCDHRHIYGKHAADFLKDLSLLIEKEPIRLLK